MECIGISSLLKTRGGGGLFKTDVLRNGFDLGTGPGMHI